MKKKHIYRLIGLIILIITVLIAILSLPQDMDNEPPSTQPTTPHSHIWGEWITEQEATCSSKGLKSRSCECGEKEEISFAMLEHSFGYWDIVTPAKCEVEGVEERICSKCELKETRSIEAIVHSGDAWTIINNEKHYLCINCGTSFKIEQLNISNGLIITNGKVSSIGSCSDNEIIIPSSATNSIVSTIGEQAFEFKGITSVILPDTITTIEKSAFNKCLKLETVYLGSKVSIIDYKAFFNCKSLKSITLPDSLTDLGIEAFAYCLELKTVYIGNSINKLETGVFKHCKSLTNIHFNGTIEEWNNIPKDTDWDFNTGKYIVHCTNGDIEK